MYTGPRLWCHKLYLLIACVYATLGDRTMNMVDDKHISTGLAIVLCRNMYIH